MSGFKGNWNRLMKAKIVYVLSSCDEDCYFEQLLLSLTSLGFNNPGCDVVILTDSSTYRRLQAQEDKLPVKVLIKKIDIPGGQGGFYNSRWIKTRIREFIDGNFLYLDTDTLVAKPLSDIDHVDADIAAVIDGNGQSLFVDRGERRKLDAAGLHDIADGPYYNGGVFYVRDTPAAHAFFSLWHSNWLKMVNEGVPPFDQASLFKTNLEMGLMIHELPCEWNVQTCYDAAVHYFKKGIIIHSYSSMHTYDESIIKKHVKENGGRLDGFALEIAANPNKYGIGIYRKKSFKGFLLYPYSDLLHFLKRYPRLYLAVSHHVDDFASACAELFSRCRK